MCTTHLMNTSFNIHFNRSTNYRDIAPREISVINGRTDDPRTCCLRRGFFDDKQQ